MLFLNTVMCPLKKVFSTKPTQRKPLYLQDIIKPLYIVTSLLGLFPYSITFVKNRHSFAVIRKSIYVNSLCGVTICLIIFAFFALHIQEVISARESTIFHEFILTQMNYVFELVALIAFCVVAYLCAFVNRNKYITILNQITTTWYSLPPNIHSKKILANLRFQANVVCMGSLTVVALSQMFVNYTRNNSIWKMILVSFTFNLPQMVQFTSLALYYFMVMMVVALMLNIKWHCERLLKDDTTIDGIVQMRCKSTLSLRQMETIYIKAFEIKTNINEAYQGLILATALQSFQAMVSEAHIIYHGVIVQQSMTTHEILNCSIWVLYQILKVYSLAYSGNQLKEQVSVLYFYPKNTSLPS